MNRRLYILDVFAEQKYAGNQLAVICDAAGLSTQEMQDICREMHFSETTFISSPEQRDGGYDVRIFTPGEEVPFAGHPTLGTAFIIQQQIIKRPVKQVVLNLAVGQIPVTFNYDAVGQLTELWMRQVQPKFGLTYGPNEIAAVLGISPEQVDERWPIQEVSTGLPFVILPLRDLAAVKQCQPDTRAMLRLFEQAEAKTILVFAPETYHPENDLHVRVFTDYLGIPEDPATGSANGCLAAYLARYRYFGSPDLSVRVEQGYQVQRKSLLLLQAQVHGDRIDVQVGGKVVLVARGDLV